METKKYVTPSIEIESMVSEQMIAGSIGEAGFDQSGNNDLGEWEIL